MLWHAIISDLHRQDLISLAEVKQLQAHERTTVAQKGKLGGGLWVANQEARRRLQFFAHSLNNPSMPTSDGVLKCPSLTVLVPHVRHRAVIKLASKAHSTYAASLIVIFLLALQYAETILVSDDEVMSNADVSRRRTDRALGSTMPFLVTRHAGEYTSFTNLNRCQPFTLRHILTITRYAGLHTDSIERYSSDTGMLTFTMTMTMTMTLALTQESTPTLSSATPTPQAVLLKRSQHSSRLVPLLAARRQSRKAEARPPCVSRLPHRQS